MTKACEHCGQFIARNDDRIDYYDFENWNSRNLYWCKRCKKNVNPKLDEHGQSITYHGAWNICYDCNLYKPNKPRNSYCTHCKRQTMSAWDFEDEF